MKILGGIPSTGVLWYRALFNLAEFYQKSDCFWKSLVFPHWESILLVKLIHYIMRIVSLEVERFRPCLTSCLFRFLFPKLFLSCQLQQLGKGFEDMMYSRCRHLRHRKCYFQHFSHFLQHSFLLLFLSVKCSKVQRKPNITMFLSIYSGALMIFKHKTVFSPPSNLLRLQKE